MGKFAFARFHQAADRGRRARIGTAGQRNVAFAGKQPGGGVQADPAGTRQIDFAPGMQVGEIHLGTGRAIETFHIGGQLDQVPGHETRRQAKVAQQLHQQPGGVTAGTARVFERVLGRLHTRLHANQVANVFAQALVEADQEVDAGQGCAVDAVEVGLELRCERQGFQVRRQFLALVGCVGERDFLGIGLEEKVEGIEDGHLRQQIDFDTQLFGFFRKHQPRQVIALGVLLPVDEVLLGRDFQRIGQDPRATVGGRAQPHNLRSEFDGAVVAVMRDVMQCDMYRHGVPPASLKRIRKRARLMPSSSAGAFTDLLRAVQHQNRAMREFGWE